MQPLRAEWGSPSPTDASRSPSPTPITASSPLAAVPQSTEDVPPPPVLPPAATGMCGQPRPLSLSPQKQVPGAVPQQRKLPPIKPQGK